METFDPIIFALATAAAGILTEASKRAGVLAERYAFLAALLFGIVVAIAIRAAGYGDGNVAMAAVAGFFAGASASGFYSGGKAVAGADQP